MTFPKGARNGPASSEDAGRTVFYGARPAGLVGRHNVPPDGLTPFRPTDLGRVPRGARPFFADKWFDVQRIDIEWAAERDFFGSVNARMPFS